ncbi:MAG: hypothetical protein A3K19_28260 [Lentisphaerae bacterium RIFOXYB12_FULL_65_16]|nr:MAG: hypothetical protein A3K18_19510 [Lentisphaerae bacterium RIFOXYA12_64_32]OGV85484.1 MAG: hypothetical protein A3K19_28260 [Lentisphaerae bacterium RIFOXYB12_FULL_65_16]
MLILLFFLMGTVLYLTLNRPFLNLACHQDAGWHSYWAAFHNRGVSLRQQMNVLVGCTRLGSKFLFRLWFALFGVGDPERISRRVFLAWNWATAGLLLAGMSILLPNQFALGAVVWIVYLVGSSNPFFGIHFETAERSALLLSVAICVLVVSCLARPAQPWLIGLVVFLMFMSSLLFKISQLVEYFPLWLVALWHEPGWDRLLFSVAGATAAIVLFFLFLWRNGLLLQENLGVIGYAARPRASPNTDPETLCPKIAQSVRVGLLRRLLLALVLCPVWPKLAPVAMRIAWRPYSTVRAAWHFMPPLLRSSRCLLLLVLLGLVLRPHYPIPERLAVAWLAGCLTAIVLQGRFFYFHFIPCLPAASILAGMGIWKLWGPLSAGHAPAVGLTSLLAVLLLLDLTHIVRLLSRTCPTPLELRLWPVADWHIMEKNLAAAEVAGYITETTREDDYVLVWGCVPQLHVLCGRRSPINWLNTNSGLMDPVLPTWRTILVENVTRLRPQLLIQFDEDLDLPGLERDTGLDYSPDRTFYHGRYRVFRLNPTAAADRTPCGSRL